MKQVLSLDQVGREPGERSLSLTEFASLPWPSEEQLKAFVDHVCDVHSWYKHLPLREGGEFKIFLANDSGDGYTHESPRLHHTWKTTEEYRRRFGFLDYSGPWGRDAGAQLSLPPEIVEATQIVLFPYVCKHCDTEACLWSVHEEDVAALLSEGPQSPSDEDALRWYSSQKRFESMELSEQDRLPLTAEEFDRLYDLEGESDIDLGPLPKPVADYFLAKREALSIYCEIQEKEEAKVRGALARLHSLYEQLNEDRRDVGTTAS